jgi:putative SOS response-associated peptidase YedK
VCGRFTQASPGEVIAELFDLPEVPRLAPRWNIAPTQPVGAVRTGAGGARELVELHWGLIPSWAKERSVGARMINARAETVAEKPAFRAALRARRCLIVADGFYEWRKTGARKQPHFIRLRDGRPFAFAGLWERWAAGPDEAVESCVIVTTTPNELLAPIHDRMPVILAPSDFAGWLDPGTRDASRVLPLLRPHPADEMEAYPVGLRVNNPGNDDPSCARALP